MCYPANLSTMPVGIRDLNENPNIKHLKNETEKRQSQNLKRCQVLCLMMTDNGCNGNC